MPQRVVHLCAEYELTLYAPNILVLPCLARHVQVQEAVDGSIGAIAPPAAWTHTKREAVIAAAAPVADEAFKAVPKTDAVRKLICERPQEESMCELVDYDKCIGSSWLYP
jgi:hypothetical protein